MIRLIYICLLFFLYLSIWANPQTDDRISIINLLPRYDEFLISEDDNEILADDKKEKLEQYLKSVQSKNAGKNIKFERLIPEEVVAEEKLSPIGHRKKNEIFKKLEKAGTTSVDEKKVFTAISLASCKECFQKTGRYITKFLIKIDDSGINPYQDKSIKTNPIKIEKIIKSKEEAMKYKLPSKDTTTYYKVSGEILRFELNSYLTIILE